MTITFHWINVASNSLYVCFLLRFPNKSIFTKLLLLRTVDLKPIKTLQTLSSIVQKIYQTVPSRLMICATKLMNKRPCSESWETLEKSFCPCEDLFLISLNSFGYWPGRLNRYMNVVLCLGCICRRVFLFLGLILIAFQPFCCMKVTIKLFFFQNERLLKTHL